MKRILITGMSGIGKPTVIRDLVSRGFRAVGTDSDEWCEWQELSVTGAPPGSTPERDWVWREDRIKQLLESDDTDVLYVSGCKSNQGQVLRPVRSRRPAERPCGGHVRSDRQETTSPCGKSVKERERA